MSHTHPPSPGIDSLITAGENCAMFDRIAARYDVVNRVMSFGLDRRWRREAVRILDPIAGGRYLDIGTGTGDVAFELVRQAPDARVSGVDPSERMLAMARQKADAREVSGRVSFQVGDAVRLSMLDACVDGVISAFCFRNVEHRMEALREMRRVLRVAGKLTLLELTHPNRRCIHLLYHVYVRLIPVWGHLAGDVDAYRYLIRSIGQFLQADELVGMLEKAGFSDVRHVPLCGGIVSIFSARKALAP